MRVYLTTCFRHRVGAVWTRVGRVRVLVCRAVAVLWSGMVLAGAGDLVLIGSTRGGDTYSDGTPVADGECYALVHTVPGAMFQGFSADGKALDPARSYVALAAGLAEKGRCPTTLFQVREADAAGREDGLWELFLLDTRGADGRPAGMDGNGRLRRVNAWHRVKGRIRAKRGGLMSPGAFEEVAVDDSSARLGGGVGKLPTEVPQPRITGIRVVDGVVRLTVADTVPYLTYDVAGTATPDDSGWRSRRMARRPQDGRAGGEIVLEVEQRAVDGTEGARFFKVVRKSP